MRRDCFSCMRRDCYASESGSHGVPIPPYAPFPPYGDHPGRAQAKNQVEIGSHAAVGQGYWLEVIDYAMVTLRKKTP
jgi:hypothetical protein